MRVLAVLAATLLAGCASAPTTTTNAPADNATATGPGGGANATNNATLPPVGERGPLVSESFVLTTDHTLAFVANATKSDATTKVPEAATGRAFFTGDLSGFKAWSASPARHAYEIVQDVDLTLAYSTDQPAATTTKEFAFPSVGGWFGTAERFAVFFAASDAPDTLEAGKVYVTHVKVKMPPGGLFVREGESLAISLYLAYEGPGQLSWVVGGPTPAGLSVPHTHFTVKATNATVVLDKSGTLPPNPNPSSESNPQPQDVKFDVPRDAVYLVADLVGTPAAAGARVDVDLHIKANGQDVASGTGPSAHEVVVLGPGGLAASGRALLAHVVGSGASGSTFKLVVTAYGP